MSKKPEDTVYADIIDLPYPHPQHPDPTRHPRMSLYKRAAQFAPFAALSGYEDLIHEEQRIVETDHQRQLEPDEAEALNQQLRRLIEFTEAGEHPAVRITYYEPDARKAGGKYVTITDQVKRVDAVERVIELMSMEGFLNKRIVIDLVSWIEIGE